MRQFVGTPISGEGKGAKIGYPTINLLIPPSFDLLWGVYRCFLKIKQKRYYGILYYGPKWIGKTAWEKQLITLEVHVLLTPRERIPKTTDETRIIVYLKEFLRKPKKLSSLAQLKNLITKDIRMLSV